MPEYKTDRSAIIAGIARRKSPNVMEIAKEIGVSGKTLYQYLREDHVVRKKTALKLIAAFGFDVLKEVGTLKLVSRSRVILEKILEYNMSIAEIAQMIGWRPQQLNIYLQKDRKVQPTTAAKIRKHFGEAAVEIIDK